MAIHIKMGSSAIQKSATSYIFNSKKRKATPPPLPLRGASFASALDWHWRRHHFDTIAPVLLGQVHGRIRTLEHCLGGITARAQGYPNAHRDGNGVVV